MPHRSTPPIVVIRRRAPVTLHTAAGPDSQTGVHVYADGRLIACIETEAHLVSAVAGLLRGPAWLFLVAARLPVQIIGRLWVLVPAETGDRAERRDLRDDDRVYAYPIADVVRAAEDPAGDDLATEAGRLLEAATSLNSGTG